MPRLATRQMFGFYGLDEKAFILDSLIPRSNSRCGVFTGGCASGKRQGRQQGDQVQVFMCHETDSD